VQSRLSFRAGAPGGRPARIPAWALALALAACAPQPDTARPVFPFARDWQAPVPRGAPPLADAPRWWQGFGDPVLDRLEALALADSPTLAAARDRARAAATAAAAVPGALSLPGGAAITARETRGAPRETAAGGDFGFGLVLDPGRGRAAERAGAAAAAALAGAEAGSARLLLAGRMAETYLAYRHAQHRLALADAEAARRRQTRVLAEELAAAGQATRVEALESAAREAEIAAERLALAAAVAAGAAGIAVLAGRAPGALPPDLAAALASSGAQPRARLAPDPGIPADLLRNRPDIAAAEAAYDLARAGVGQARAALYPRLSLAGTIEASVPLGSGGVHAGSTTFGPALRLHALPAGPARAGLAAREAEVAAAHADWVAAVLAALAEVETALLDYRAAAGAEAAAARAVALYAEAAGLRRELAARGEATLGDLIAAEDSLARAETALAAARLARGLGFVRLNVRLGAGAADPGAAAAPPGRAAVSAAAPVVAAPPQPGRNS